MGIQITNAVSQPAVTFNKIHLTKLEIVQPTFTDDQLSPVYGVVVNYRHYGIADGVRHYASEDVQRVAIQDYIQLAQQQATAGDNSLLVALGAIETAVAKIIEDQAGETAVVV